MNVERRSSQRETPEKLSYIQFEPEGGGIVLNASEQGLAFHAANAVKQPGPMRLSISPNPTQRLELSAEIVWLDDAKKFGGLRFREISADVKNGIRQWLAQTAASSDSDSELAAPSYASSSAKEAADPHTNAGKKTASPPRLISDLEDARPVRAGFATSAVPPLFTVPSPSPFPEPISQRNQASLSLAPLLRGLALGILFFILAFTAFLFLQNTRQEVGNSLTRLAERLKRNSKTPAETSSSPPVPASSPSVDNSSSVPDSIREIPSLETLDPSRPASSAPSIAGTGDATESHNTDTKNFRTNTTADTYSKRDRSPRAQELWSALEAGNSSAEAVLAQLYLTGDGVPRNCEQARVLLRAASKKGNSEALQQLRKLNNNHTCR